MPTAFALGTTELQRHLRTIGWSTLAVDGQFGPRTRQAVHDFQRGYALRLLEADGHPDEDTAAAIQQCVADGGRCSAHFTFREFASKGDGWIKVLRELVIGLEAYRKLTGQPEGLASGYRDPAHNAAVGGAPKSMHKQGAAADLVPKMSLEKVKALGCFSGIGYVKSNGLVRHVDVRHVLPAHNVTGGSLANPTTWPYG